jgi:hypothetical protein
VNRAVHPATAEQRAVCGVYDRIHVLIDDVALDQLNHRLVDSKAHTGTLG